MKAIIEERTQRFKGRWPKRGPDCYIAVQVVPDGVEPLKVLRRDHAAKRGIEIIYVGEAYSNRRGPRSTWWMLHDEAKEIASKINSKRPAS